MNLKQIGFGSFLEEEEVVDSAFRHSFFKIFGKIIIQVVIWGTVAYLVHFYWNNYYYDYDYDNTYSWLFLIPAAIGSYKILQVFMHWYFNSILMTNESLVFIEFNNIFDRRSKRINYWDLDDIDLEKKGFSDYIGNKGDLVFTKVSGGAPIIFEKINNPRKIIKKIRKFKTQMLHEKNFSEESALKDLLSQMVQTHVRKSGQPEEERQFYREELERINKYTSKQQEKATKIETAEEYLEEYNFEKLKEEELQKLRTLETKNSREIVQETEEIIEFEEIEEETVKGFHISHITNSAKKLIKKHFHNELEDEDLELGNIDSENLNIEVEKELDDNGGLEIDLDK